MKSHEYLFHSSTHKYNFPYKFSWTMWRPLVVQVARQLLSSSILKSDHNTHIHGLHSVSINIHQSTEQAVKVIWQKGRISAAWRVQSYSSGGGNVHRDLIHASLGPPESATQIASRPVQRFLQAHDCDRPTDRPHYSVCNNRPHLHTTQYCNVV